jgi:predicted Zn-dependent protease
MNQERIERLERLREKNPEDPMVLYSLGNEYLKAERHAEAAASLEAYLRLQPDDEGAGFRMLAQALVGLGREEEAAVVLRRGRDAALAHDHPTMAEELEEALAGLEGRSASS